MQRKRASDFDQRILELYDGYVHGRMTKRAFLDHAIVSLVPLGPRIGSLQMNDKIKDTGALMAAIFRRSHLRRGS